MNPIYTSRFIKKAASDEATLRRVQLARLQITDLNLLSDPVDCYNEQLLQEFIETTSLGGNRLEHRGHAGSRVY